MNLTLNEYQTDANRNCLSSDFTYVLMNLTGEAGKVVGVYAKYVRDGGVFPHAELIEALGDVLCQVAIAADRIGMDLSEIADINLENATSRQASNVLSGADDR
jgi:NTP pyrophosphatase (non-canonical NTP hydrolase)